MVNFCMFLSFADCDDSINSSRRLLIIIFATSLIFLSIIFTNMFVYLLLNMNKYFSEYPNKDIYVCFDGAYYLVNLKFKHKDEEYLYNMLMIIIAQILHLKEYPN